jgi:hypothetical protein
VGALSFSSSLLALLRLRTFWRRLWPPKEEAFGGEREVPAMREEERASKRAVVVWAYAKQLRVCGVRDEQWRRRETRGGGEVPSVGAGACHFCWFAYGLLSLKPQLLLSRVMSFYCGVMIVQAPPPPRPFLLAPSSFHMGAVCVAGESMRIAIVGASLGGLSAANALHRVPLPLGQPAPKVTIFEQFPSGFHERGGALGSVNVELVSDLVGGGSDLHAVKGHGGEGAQLSNGAHSCVCVP